MGITCKMTEMKSVMKKIAVQQEREKTERTKNKKQEEGKKNEK